MVVMRPVVTVGKVKTEERESSDDGEGSDDRAVWVAGWGVG